MPRGFLIDENLSPTLASHLGGTQGIDTVHVNDTGLHEASDPESLTHTDTGRHPSLVPIETKTDPAALQAYPPLDAIADDRDPLQMTAARLAQPPPVMPQEKLFLHCQEHRPMVRLMNKD